jgi:23S rRNA pseudouridine1911/1915/1917 synthase
MEAATPRIVVVPLERDGDRLDRVLASALTDVSRSRIKQQIERGRVTLDEQAVTHASRRVRAGQTLRLHLEPLPPARLEAEDIPLEILHMDAHLVVVNKPAGLVVHPGAGNPRGTLVNALLAKVRLAFPDDQGERPGLIHRLDKDTSGVIAVTRHPDAQDRYSALFSARQVRKIYLAIVQGRPGIDRGVLDTFYGRHPGNRVKYSSRVTAGKRAITEYKVLARGRHASALAVRIKTGRTHQIRVHLADAGFPVVADSLYGRPLPRPHRYGADPEFQALFALPRQALHAWKLGFVDPFSDEAREFIAPIPDDLRPIVEILELDI